MEDVLFSLNDFILCLLTPTTPKVKIKVVVFREDI